MPYRAGFVALVGKPNVGKSTLMNRIVGQKVSIVSNKPQTTRKRVTGIATTADHQIAFIDTPGVHEPHTVLGRSMVDQARASLSEADLVLLIVDGAHHPGEGDQSLAAMLKGLDVPVLLVMNKMDQLRAENVQRHVDAYTKLFQHADLMMTTATTGANVDKLVAMVVERLPERAPIFGEDEFTDQSTRFLAGELVREKVLIATRQEIPHATAVVVDNWEEDAERIHIYATILVERDSQRAILIGKQGQFIKDVGTKARLEIEALVGKKVYLDLHVKVSEGWRMNPRILHELEYDSRD